MISRLPKWFVQNMAKRNIHLSVIILYATAAALYLIEMTTTALVFWRDRVHFWISRLDCSAK
jgi:hypothetical protein